jgi:hypothetical protein
LGVDQAGLERKEVSASFLKKRSKKLLITVGVGVVVATARKDQKFFCFVFFKKEVLPYSAAGARMRLP